MTTGRVRVQHGCVILFGGVPGLDGVSVGLGDRDQLRENETLRQQVGEMVYSHLLAYLDAGRRIRQELLLMLADCPYIIFVNSLDELKQATSYFLNK